VINADFVIQCHVEKRHCHRDIKIVDWYATLETERRSDNWGIKCESEEAAKMEKDCIDVMLMNTSRRT